MTIEQIQQWLNENLLGPHNYVAQSGGYLIVGFEVLEQIWECHEGRIADEVKEVRSIGQFARYDEAVDLEARRHRLGEKHRSYFTSPIQVKAPSTLTGEPVQAASEDA